MTDIPDEVDFSSLSIREMRELWESRIPAIQGQRPDWYLALAKKLRHRSQPFWTFEVAVEGRDLPTCDPETYLELSQIAALSLARTGARESAEAELLKLLEQAPSNVETLSLLGRVQKDRAHRSGTEAERTRLLELASEYYGAAARHDPEGYYPLINAATLTLLLGRTDAAHSMAQEVKERCTTLLAKEDHYWIHASLGEAQLILGNTELSIAHYREAAQKAGDDYSALQSMRSQAFALLKQLGIPREVMAEVFVMPAVLVFSGHRPDSEDRESPRFPADALAETSRSLLDAIKQHSSCIAYASAAPGADILFCEAVIQLGHELRLVLPTPLHEFRDYVKETSSPDWLKRFDAVAKAAINITEASQAKYNESVQGPSLYDFVNRLILGSAKAEAHFLDADLKTIAVWDGEPNPSVGGTSDCIRLWSSHGIGLDTWIDSGSGTIAESSDDALSRNSSIATTTDSELPQTTKFILFSDIVGFSGLEDSELPEFFEGFLKRVADRIATLNIKPLAQNSWGDAFFFVFDSASDAGRFALEMQRAIAADLWIPASTNKALRCRVALNAGSVFAIREPMSGAFSFVGSPTNRAARIEPIVQEGQIYASEYFAALANVETLEDFALEYVGNRILPKSYGTSRVFALIGKKAD